MAPPRNNRDEPSIQEHEYAIRRLTELVALQGDQIESNANKSRATHEELLVLKTKIAVYSALAGAAGTTAVLLFKTFALKQ